MSCDSAGFAFPVNRASVSDSTINVPWSDHSGWGGRIRTAEWRDQNPLPYHLATPQQSSTQHRMQRRAIQSARDKTAPSVWNSRRDALRILGALEAGEDARTGTGHARRDRRAVRIDLSTQPRERLGHLRAARAYYRFKDVDGAAFGKGAYWDVGRISCQFRGLEDLSGTHADPGPNHQKPARRQFHRRKPLPAALPPGRVPKNKHRHVGSQLHPQQRQLFQAQLTAPQRVERQQHAGRIRAAAAQPATGRNTFNDLDVRAQGHPRSPL